MTDWGEATVRVTGVRRARFVEFDFSLGDELVVELVLPYREFRDFCAERQAEMLPAEGDAALQYLQLGATASESATSTTPTTPGPPGSSNRPGAGEEDTT